jgi:zinc transport system substrate-binding protein
MELLLLMGLLLVTGCRSAPKSSTNRTVLRIIVSIPPQAYFVDRIGGDAVVVETMVPAGAEPHTYEPKPDQLRAVSQADAYLRIRVDFEDAWMDRFLTANPQMMVVDTTQGIERSPLPPAIPPDRVSHLESTLESTLESIPPTQNRPFDRADRHSLGHIGGQQIRLSLNERNTDITQEPSGGQVDPHIWLSPQLVKIQASTIAATLSQLAPDQARQFQANLNAFLQDIDQLDADIRRTLEGVANRQFLVFHPAWGYFAKDYDLQMLAIEVGGQEPSAAELARLIRFAQQHQIKVIFASPQFSQRDAETIAKEISGEVLLIDPLAYDWLDNLQHVATTFADVLRPSTAMVATTSTLSHEFAPSVGSLSAQARSLP